MHSITSEPNDRGKRLDHFLQEQFPQYSRARLQSWIKEDRVRLDGVAVRPSHVLRGGEQVWRGERVHVKQEYVTATYEKRFSKGRTIALSAAGIGAVAIMASQGIIGGGQGDPGKAPGDTSHTSRGRKP